MSALKQNNDVQIHIKRRLLLSLNLLW